MSRYDHESCVLNNVNLMEQIQITLTEQQIAQGWCKNEKTDEINEPRIINTGIFLFIKSVRLIRSSPRVTLSCKTAQSPFRSDDTLFRKKEEKKKKQKRSGPSHAEMFWYYNCQPLCQALLSMLWDGQQSIGGRCYLFTESFHSPCSPQRVNVAAHQKEPSPH